MILVYFFLWLALSGRVTPEVALVGLAAAAGLDLFIRRVLKIDGPRPTELLRRTGGLLASAVGLVRDVARANLALIRLVLAPELEVEPCLVRLRTARESLASRVALANSITLTPGTITVDLAGNELQVHALTHTMALGLANHD